jgi:hypothetical protein
MVNILIKVGEILRDLMQYCDQLYKNLATLSSSRLYMELDDGIIYENMNWN